MKMTYKQARGLALFALIVCATGMVVCRWFEADIPWLAWVRAFCEAGTIGALADWFAVVVLFRHPLGIPIPHTAILPNNKDRVGASLADFIETSFLTENQLGPKFRGIDYAGFAAAWLVENEPLLADKAAGYAPKIVTGFSDEEMSGLLAERGRDLIRRAEVGPMAAAGIEVVIRNGRDRDIFLALLQSTRDLIEEHRPTIQSKIRDEIPLSADLLGGIPALHNLAAPLLEQLRDHLAAAVADKTIRKVQAALDEAAQDPASPLWLSFHNRLGRFIGDLKTSPELADRIRQMQDGVAGSGAVDDFASKVWEQIKEFVLRDCAAADSTVRRKIEEAIRSAATQLADSERARAEVNQFLGEQVLMSILTARPHARELITSTIAAWDAKEMADRLEKAVGSDLQFIRINGTVVGGLIGLVIHATFWLVGK